MYDQSTGEQFVESQIGAAHNRRRGIRNTGLLVAPALLVAAVASSVGEVSANEGEKLQPGVERCFDTGIADAGDFAVMNIAATQQDGRGFMSFHEPGAPWDQHANINYPTTGNRSNGTGATVDEGGELCVTTRTATHAVVDLEAAIDGLVFTPASESGPVRVLDTRNFDDQTGGQKARAGEPVCVTAPNAQEGSGVRINLAVDQTDGRGFVGLHTPENADAWRDVSYLNFTAGETISNGTTVVAGAGGEFCATPRTDTHLIIDVAGSIDPSVMNAATPDGAVRLFDTRLADSPTNGEKIRAPGMICEETGAPEGALAQMTIAGMESNSRGFVNVFPASSANPFGNANLNLPDEFVRDGALANSFDVLVGENGEVCAVMVGLGAHLTLDFIGYIDESVVTPAGVDGAVRVMDSRIVEEQFVDESVEVVEVKGDTDTVRRLLDNTAFNCSYTYIATTGQPIRYFGMDVSGLRPDPVFDAVRTQGFTATVVDRASIGHPDAHFGQELLRGHADENGIASDGWGSIGGENGGYLTETDIRAIEAVIEVTFEDYQPYQVIGTATLIATEPCFPENG